MVSYGNAASPSSRHFATRNESSSGSRTARQARLPPANANGWYGGPIGPTVTFTCDDNIPVGLVCPHALTLGEGADQSVSGTATDGAGNEATIVMSGLDVDLTRPTIAFSGNSGSYTVDQTVAITCTATDALSRVDPAHTTCPGASGPAYAFAVGTHTLSATATDRAGNDARSDHEGGERKQPQPPEDLGDDDRLDVQAEEHVDHELELRRPESFRRGSHRGGLLVGPSPFMGVFPFTQGFSWRSQVL